MKKILYSLLIFAFALSTNAQIGGIKLKKPKIKKEDILKKDKDEKDNTTIDGSDSSNGGSGLGGPPKYDSESPMYKAYSNAKTNLKWANSAMESQGWKTDRNGTVEDISEYLVKARKSLDELQNNAIESKKGYLKDLETDYSNLNEIITKEKGAAEEYEGYVNTIMNWNACFKHYDYATDCVAKVLTAKGYYSIRNEFKEKYPETFANIFPVHGNKVSELDRYFEGSYEMVNTIDENLKRIEKHMHLTYQLHFETEVEPGENYLFDTDHYLEEIEDEQKKYNYYKDTVWMELRPEAIALQERITKQKVFLEEVISSGRGKKQVDAFWEKVADEVRMMPTGMTDAGLESFIKTEFAKKGYGKWVKVKIVGSDWKVSKNYMGIPLQKSLLCQVVFKKDDGRCYLFSTVRIIRKYEGGGKYGNKALVVYGSDYLMNCANVNK